MTDDQDPILARRAKIARLTELGQRVGYGLFGAAVLLFIVGAVRGFTGLVTATITACLIGGSAVLAPAIVFGFAVKAADREDRQAREARDRRENRGPK